MNNYFNEKSFNSVDSKGRLLLPKDIRNAFKLRKSDVLYLVPNLGDQSYLEVRTKSQWKTYCERLRNQDVGQQKKDSFRYAMMVMEEAAVDGQGRILIPQRIRESCKLDDQVAVVTMQTYFEIWARGQVEQRYADMVRAFKETNDRLF